MFGPTNGGVYLCPLESYVKDTLPNEWVPSWNAEALKAGAVIIRSGIYWRVNRFRLGAGFPNNNCYQGTYCYTFTNPPICINYDTKAPLQYGGVENFFPDSQYRVQGASNTNAAVNATFQYHAETLNTISGRPDQFIMLRYNSTIQNRTNGTTGGWLDRIWYAYTGAGHPGSPLNPNVNCNQTDAWTPTINPIVINY